MKKSEVDRVIDSLRRVGQQLADINKLSDLESLNLHTLIDEDGVTVSGYAVLDDEILFTFDDFIGKGVDDQ